MYAANSDSDGGYVDGAHVAHAAKKSTWECVSSEAKRAMDSRVPPPSGSSTVPSSVLSLAGDDNYALPEVLPAFSVSWPEAVMTAWSRFKAYSTVGVFASLSRAYIVADNRLLLWNFATGKEFLCYDEISELILAVSEPVVPRSGIFQPHITHIIACATPHSLHFIGVSQLDGDVVSSELRLHNVGYAITSPCAMVKICVHPTNGRMFCAGSDGNVYEVEYAKDGSLYQSRMRLLNLCIAFGKIPILTPIGLAVHHLKQTWWKPLPPLRDMCLDAPRNLLFTLDVDSTIVVWKLVERGLERHNATKHDLATIMKSLHSNAPSSPAPLMLLFSCRTERGLQLSAVAENGDVYRYACSDFGWSAACAVEVRERTSFPVVGNASPASHQNRILSAAFCCAGASVFAHAAGPEEPDSVSLLVAPSVSVAPFQHAKESLCTFSGDVTGITRVDSIAEVTSDRLFTAFGAEVTVASQLFCPRNQIVVVHRGGVSTFQKLRPVDILHTIFLSNDAARKDELLKRFQAAHAPVEHACMLLQLAVGDAPVSQYVAAAQAAANSAPLAHHAATPLAAPQRLGRQVLQPPTHEVQRSAKDLLMKLYAFPTWADTPRGSASFHLVVISKSVFLLASQTMMGRALSCLWDQTILSVPGYVLAVVEKLLARLRHFLDAVKQDVWPDVGATVVHATLWESSGKTNVRLPLRTPNSPTRVTPQEVRTIHTVAVRALAEMLEDAIQAIKFVRLLSECRSGLSVEDVRFSELFVVADKAQSVARNICRQIVGASHRARELDRLLTKIQTECPRLVAGVDLTEYHVRLELDRLTNAASSNGLQVWAPEKVREFEARVIANAAQLWYNGALPLICDEMRALKREDSAVKFLLHAAAQVDPDKRAVEAFSLHRGFGARSATSSYSGGSAEYQEKVKIVQVIVGLLECAWEHNKKVADVLIGSPHVPGTIWSVQSTDEVTQCLLIEWFLSPRENEAIQRHMSDTLICSGASAFLELHLERCCAAGYFGLQYAQYLRVARRDYSAAVTVLSQLAQGSLLDMPADDRLRFRMDCWVEAQECAAEGHLVLEAQEIERQAKLVSAQMRLVEMLKQCVVDEPSEEAQRKLAAAREALLDENELMVWAEELVRFGGGEVQLMVLSAFNSVNPAHYVNAVENCFRRKTGNAASTAESLLKKFANQPGFPVANVLRYLERFSYENSASKEGSTYTVDVLCECGVDLHVAFAHVADILERRQPAWSCYDPLEGHVPDAFVYYTLVSLVKRIASSPQLRGSAHMLSPIIQTAREVFATVEARCRRDATQRRVLDSALRILDQCQSLASR